MIRGNWRAVLFAGVLFGGVASLSAPRMAAAAPITFIHTGSGSGALGRTFFGPSAFTITSTADTNSREFLGDVTWINHLTSVIEIEGLGTFNLTSGTRTFVNTSGAIVGYSRSSLEGSADLFNGPTAVAFASWDMSTSIGPIAGDTAQLLQWGIAPEVTTDGGILLFFNESEIDATFEAIVVPEPAGLVLAAPCVAWLLMALARRARRADGR
jgi:hypothetical protein